MKFTLNTERSGFLTIGHFAFNFAQEEHEIDVESIPSQLLSQLWYNVSRGTLFSDDRTRLAQLATASQQPVTAPQPIQQKQVLQVVNTVPKDPIQEDQKELRAILRRTIPSVKKAAGELPLGRLRRLLELEKETKNRKAIVSFLEEKLAKNSDNVVSILGNDDKGPINQVDPFGHSTQVSDIVESEEKELVFSQDILDQLKE